MLFGFNGEYCTPYALPKSFSWGRTKGRDKWRIPGVNSLDTPRGHLYKSQNMTSTQTSNRLNQEKSPYLLQHKDNPIAWFAWGEAAFAKARQENKPIFLSVGYSTCHWCHVMAHESFEDQEVAGVLNEKFVSIKVDREERPDVDDVYMRALQALSGGGGWPMSIWLTPDGKPFFAGTYFPKFRFLQLLRRIDTLWASERDSLLRDGERLTLSILESKTLSEGESTEVDWEETLKPFITNFQHHYDEENGGFGQAPKFPQSMNLMLMVRQDSATGLNQAEAMVTGTLGAMLRGGIYDQLRGGFHRYSVDEKWLVPHFEKMLYDQALLSVALLDAGSLYQDAELIRGARETLDYVRSEMTHKDGGFYSAQDADSLDPVKGHNEEGYFATYAFAELKEVLSEEELSVLSRVYGVTPQGDFEGRSILHLQPGFDGKVKDEPLVRSSLAKLEELRSSKPQPHLDDKIIAAWNGWMIWAFARAAAVCAEPEYLLCAQKALTFVKEKMWSQGKLARFWRDGETRANAAAEDYASLIHACLELHQVDLNPQWVSFALELQASLDQGFWDREDGGYFANDGQDPLLPLRTKDDYDGVTPCANSMAAYNLVRLYLLTGEGKFKHQADRIFEMLFAKFKQYPSGLPFLAMAMDFHLNEAKVAVLNGRDWVLEFFHEQSQKFQPYVYWTPAESGWPVAKNKQGSDPSIYVCLEGRCLKPAMNKVEAAVELSF